MPGRPEPTPATDAVKALAHFLYEPDTDDLSQKEIRSRLSAAGVNMENVKKRYEIVLAQAAGRAVLAGARTQRQSFDARMVELRERLTPAGDVRAQVREFGQDVFGGRAEAAVAWRNFEQATDADLFTMLEDLTLLEELERMILPLPQLDLNRAKAAAFKLTSRYGFLHPSQMTIEDVAWDRGVVVSPGSLDGSEARLVRKGKRGAIRVRAGVGEIGRRRFSIAHELGHWELHEESQWLACSAADLRDYKKSPEEAEANTFAAELLMPTCHVRERCEKSSPSLELAKAIADEFQVSLTAAGIRVVHLTKQECILVASKDRKVSWWIPKGDRFGVWLR